jgi:alpha-L-fucosidase
MNKKHPAAALPKDDAHNKRTCLYVEETPDADYKKARRGAVKSFKDIKFAVRVHFGLYSIKRLNGESWGFLGMTHAEKAAYNELYKSFNPTGFDAERWCGLFADSGAQAFTVTAKHHEGFSLFDTKARVKKRVDWAAAGGPRVEDCDLAYSVAETPFKRDIIKELCDSARGRGLKIGLYYSHPDWYDYDFAPYTYHPARPVNEADLVTAQELSEWRMGPESFYYGAPAVSKENEDRLVARHRKQIVELLTNYGKVDMLCLDMWFGARIWPRIKETVKAARKIQPNVMMRCRGVGNYGDYYTPENFLPGKPENTDMPWMVIYGLGNSFSYDADGKNYKGAGWIIRNIASAASKGGSFMVGIGPDETGEFHAEAARQLRDAGRWLKIHGEAVYGSVMFSETHYEEKHGGGTTYFTASADRRYAYAISAGNRAHRIAVSLPRDSFGEIRLLTPAGPALIPESEILSLDGMFVVPKAAVQNLYGNEYAHASVLRLARFKNG